MGFGQTVIVVQVRSESVALPQLADQDALFVPVLQFRAQVPQHEVEFVLERTHLLIAGVLQLHERRKFERDFLRIVDMVEVADHVDDLQARDLPGYLGLTEFVASFERV